MGKQAVCVAVLGTGSDVGKSIVTSALCRILANQGVRVAPFKAQNMSNNSGVTAEGLEMGRAQIVQAEAARIAPHVDMNPVLLKPTSDVGSQVVLHGKAWLEASARSYYEQKAFLFQESCAALDRLRNQYEVVVMEGAGSCAEVNLMANDIVNLRAAAYAQAPVILVADIDRGGVFAQIVGTLACLSSEQQEQIAGFVINRFRGDIRLFQPGVDWIEERTAKPVFGVLPWYRHFHIEAEDAVTIENVPSYTQASQDQPAVAVIKLPHISNFTDFDPLLHTPGLELVYLQQPQDLASFAGVILPGSKSTRSDLEWLAESGWQERLLAYARGGGHVLGVCGGYQMLGSQVHDPQGIEGQPGSTRGLGLLEVETVLKAPKTTTLTDFSWAGHQGRGYEIHMGQTTLQGGRPLIEVEQRNQEACQDSDGCISADGRVIGTYIHGLFDTPAITAHWLQAIGLAEIRPDQSHGPLARDRAYEQLAEHMAEHLDVEAILALIHRQREGGAA
ncbi:cobyric acid synthase [Desulfogranum mediterraneum]|uniref:cobyric acid synthase n=1 Tax=Desulfogranum mediterraneum TaxID=160661 RepID=UPI00048CC865|nr:cobyric acid synthase [Desulfogranum mediterraneum]